MSRLWKISSRFALALAFLATAAIAQASVFSDVSENTSTGGPLFGDPTEVGDYALDFDPTMFKSLTIGQGSDIKDSQLSFNVSGTPITGVWILERGDYALAGTDASSAQAVATLSVFYEIEDVDGVELGTPINGTIGVDVGSWSLASDGIGGGDWDGQAMVDVAGILADNNVDGTATRIHITLDNNLSTAATAGGAAFIAKKDADIIIHIPEPASASMAGLGLIGLVGLVRRRRKA